MPAAARLRVLGPIEVTGPDGVVVIREGLPRRLLAALAVRPGTPVAVDVLIESLWDPARRPADGRNALQVQVSYLRRQLERAKPDIVLERSADAYRISLSAPGVLDSVVFEQGVRRATQLIDAGTFADLHEALDVLEDAISLWRGEPFADASYDLFAQAEIQRLAELHVSAQERRAHAMLALGRHVEAVEQLRALATEHPLRESVWSSLMLALYRSRRQADALRAYGEARDHLVDELGVDPGLDLREMERRVLQQDPALDWSPPGDSVQQPGPVDAVDIAAIDATLSSAVSPVASHVPIEVSTLVGRGFETDHVERLVGMHRLITLLGPGGIGKTRVAIEVAHRLKESMPTRVIGLAPLAPDADLGLVLAADLGVPTDPRADPLDSIAARLADPTVLVLDTCEHMIDAVAALVSRLLRRSPHLRVVATSRQPLGVSGEVVWSVPALELADPDADTATGVAASPAVRLFVERATAARAGFVLDDSNAADIARICRALDGIPLAIELAAARVNVLSPARIVDRLGDRFALLSRGGRDVDARQRSLRATIEWSHEMLTHDQQRFYARLSVIAGSFDVDAAVAIAGRGLGGDPLDLLGALVDRSLVRNLDGDRFSLLDTLREFAAERLDEPVDIDDIDDMDDSADSARRRHAEWYFDLAVAADPWAHGPLPEHWSRLRTDATNCLAALEWFHANGERRRAMRLAAALAGFWALQGQITRARHWLSLLSAVDRDDGDGGDGRGIDDPARAMLLRGLGVLELYQNRFVESIEACSVSVATARGCGDDRLVASTLLPLGSAQWGVGDHAGSIATLSEATALFERHGDRRGQGFALARMGRTLTAVADARAISTLQRSVELLSGAGDRWMLCVAYEHLANAYLQHGMIDSALDTAQQAVDMGAEAGSHAGRQFALGTLGRVLLAAGQLGAALRVDVTALGTAIEAGNPGATADALDASAAVLAGAGRHDLGAELLGAANAMRESRHVSVPAAIVAPRAAMVDGVRSILGAQRFDELERGGRARTPAWVTDRIREQIALFDDVS